MSNTEICAYCVRSLSNISYKCCICNNITLCYFCFIHGVESGAHLKTHSYKIIPNAREEKAPSVACEWTIKNEIQFLDEIERYGVGNWEEISKKIGVKTPLECRRHFEVNYLEGLFTKDLKEINKNPEKKAIVFDDSFEFHSKKSDTISVPSLLSSDDECLLGFMRNREDFEREYENEAESLLTRIMSTSTTDQQTENEIQLKVAHIDIYNGRIYERLKRKNVAIQHGIVNLIMNHILGKKCGKRRGTTVTSLADGISQHPYNRSFTAMCSRIKRTSSMNKSYINHVRLVNKPLTPVDLAKRNNPESDQSPFFEQLSNYDCFNINDRLKSYIRYLNPLQAYQFLNNLHREEILTSEIKILQEMISKGKKSLTDGKPRRSLVKSKIFVYPEYRSDAKFRKKRRNSYSTIDENNQNQSESEIIDLNKSDTSSTVSEKNSLPKGKRRRISAAVETKNAKLSRGNSSILSFYKKKSETIPEEKIAPPTSRGRRGKSQLSIK